MITSASPVLLALAPNELLSALLGGIVGGLIAEARLHLSERRARSIAIRKTLYHLLQARDALGRMNILPLLTHLAMEGQKQLPQFFPAETEKTIVTPEIREWFRGLIPPGANNILERHLEGYRLSIDELCSFDPVLAHRLSGHDRISLFDAAFQNYRKTIEGLTAGPSQGDTLPVLRAVAMDFSQSVLEDALDSLEGDIRTTAYHLGTWEWLQVRWSLWQEGARAEAFIQEAVERYLELITKHQLGQSVSGQSGVETSPAR